MIGLMLLAMVAGNASADWEPAFYNKGNTRLTYVDLTTISKSGSKATMWTLDDLKTTEYLKQKSFRSMMGQAEYECNAKKTRILYAQAYSDNMGKGIVVESDATLGPWQPVPTGSTGEVAWKIACGILKPH